MIIVAFQLTNITQIVVQDSNVISVTPGCINEGSVPALIKMPTGVAYSLVPNLNTSIILNTKLTILYYSQIKLFCQ
jgi:hypothetical protein